MARPAVRPQTPAQTREIETRPVDLVHLARQTLGDKGLEVEVLRIYDRLANSHAERINAATGSKELVMHLHTLKGAAAGIGARGVAAQALAAETELRETGALGLETRADLDMAVVEASTFIAALINE